MAIKVGERLPTGALWEFIEEETPGCSVGPSDVRCSKCTNLLAPVHCA